LNGSREHDANQAAIDAVLDDHLASWAEYDEYMIDLSFKVKDQLSRDEWAALFGGSQQALSEGTH
jgi:hypothetical protein